MFKVQTPPNRWKGFLTGALGGAVGVVAMSYYWKAATTLNSGKDPRMAEPPPDRSHALDEISPWGLVKEEGESSTAAMGRILYQTATGKKPESEELRNTLSYLYHWAFSMVMGGLYGAARAEQGLPDVLGGTVFGTGVWLLGDELGVAFLGVASGPTASAPITHVAAFGAHQAYGLATAVTAQLLNALLPD